MTFPLKNTALASGKRNRSKIEEEMGSKRPKYDLTTALGDMAVLNRHRIYNSGIRKKPAELFRKDLISAMKLPDSDQLNQEDYLLITDTWKEEWEKGVQVPVNPDSLPDGSHVRPVVPAYRDIQKSSSSETPQAPGSPFKMPKKLHEYEPDRDVIASKYELDLTDHFWLQSLRDSEEMMDIEEDMFEEVMNELEYQCARNMKAKHVGIEFDDHIVCDICRSPDAEDGNEMVFCDLCNICVHQACYGIVAIPDGEWLCRPCKQFGSQAAKKISCLFCPNAGGAFKPTNTNRWAHLSCALWIPEVSIGCVSTMEPITKIKSIPASRWALVCSFCNVKQGAPIQCSVKTCKVAYHVTCAFNHHLKLKAVVEPVSKGVKLKSYCSKHMDAKDSEANSSESEANSEKGPHEILITTSSNSESDKNNRFWMYIDISEINQMLIPKFTQQFPSLSSPTIILYMDIILQYWKMKRTSNFGLPLIKVVTQDTIEEIQMAHRNDILRLRVHLERIRNLSYMITRREKMKRSWLTCHREIVQLALSLATGVQQKVTNGGSHNLFPSRVSGVPEELLLLARNVISSNVIYNEETEADKLRSKRVIKELNRLAKIDHLPKRSPNPYERKYMKGQLKRREVRADDDDDDHDQELLLKQTTPTKINGSKVNGSSLLIRSPTKSPLSPAKTSPSSTENLTSRSLLMKSPIKSHNKNRHPQSLLQPVSTRSSEGQKNRRPHPSPKKVLNPASTAVIKLEDEDDRSSDCNEDAKQVCCLN